MSRFSPDAVAQTRRRLEAEKARKHPNPSIVSMCQLYLDRANAYWAGMRSHATATHPED